MSMINSIKGISSKKNIQKNAFSKSTFSNSPKQGLLVTFASKNFKF